LTIRTCAGGFIHPRHQFSNTEDSSDARSIPQKNECIDLFMDGVKIAEVILVDLRGDKARVGITASEDIEIHRREISIQVHPDETNRFEAGETARAAS
jgi:sRNA-binding carbon storage regulator CsrA